MSLPDWCDLDKDIFNYQLVPGLPGFRGLNECRQMRMAGGEFAAFFQLWLQLGRSFGVRATVGMRPMYYSVRVKPLPASKGQWWYAQARVCHKNRQKYIGKPDQISLWKLEETLQHFSSIRDVNERTQGR